MPLERSTHFGVSLLYKVWQVVEKERRSMGERECCENYIHPHVFANKDTYMKI
jgi:hypothetical protein